MFANYEKKIIEMTKSESKSAGKVGTAVPRTPASALSSRLPRAGTT